MSVLSHKNGILLLCAVLLVGISVPRFPVFAQTVDPNIRTTLLKAAIPTTPRSSSIKTSNQGAAQAPVIQGWGGVTLDEASNGQLQSTLLRLNQSGYNGVRIGFSGSTTQCSSGELGSWNPDWFSQTIQAAQQYNMWVILDYHSYGDLVSGVCQTEWLSFWNGVLAANWGYDRIVWEPINEPAGNVTVLSSAYQAWITLARGIGDKHWIAVENTISNGGCNFDPLSLVSCYPIVTDPLNETFLSIHPYLFYNIWASSNSYGNCDPNTNTWGNSTAECIANIYNLGMLQASSKYHMPILDTEGGAVYYSCNNVCPPNPPDAVGTDDASYSNTTFHFIQYLTNLMQSENMGWLWWEAGEGSCCGALDTWGALLRFQPVNPPRPIDTPPILEAPSGDTVIVGLTLSFKINASDPDIPLQNLTLSCPSCPLAGFPTVIGLGQVTGNFNWTPISSETGQHTLTFTVSDGSKSSSATILITVYPANGPPQNIPPVLIIPGNQTLTVASTVSFTVKATDIEIPFQALALTCLDCASLSATFMAATGISPVTGTFNWDPSNNRVPGIYSVHFRVTDGISATGAVVPITLTKVNIEMATSVYPRTITIGLSPASASDTATLIDGYNPTGSITFNVFFSNASCTGIPLFTSTALVNKNGDYPSQLFTPQAAGTYQWETSYTGDLNNFLAETQCGHPSEIMMVQSATPPPQPQPPPRCQCNPSGGSSFLGSPIFWLALGGIAGLVVVAVATISRKRTRRKLSS